MADHQHEHHFEMPQKSKYEEALSKYNLENNDDGVKAAVKKINAER